MRGGVARASPAVAPPYGKGGVVRFALGVCGGMGGNWVGCTGGDRVR